MPKTAPPKKAPAKTEAAPATVAAPAPKEWTNLEIAVQMEVTVTGVVNPFTKEIIARDVGGVLDVRRPGGAQYPKPENIKVTGGDIASPFGKWFLDACYLAPITAEEVNERYGIKDFTMPEVEVDPSQSPIALVTGTYGPHDFAFVYVGGKVARVGKRTERGYVWAYSGAMLKQRGAVAGRSTRASTAEDAFKSMMKSFTGKFRAEPAAAAPAPKPTKASKTPPAKAPAKTAPKKVPSKK